ncbi:MAG: hypothetical protein QOG76_6061 [Pseudonocardiales bacterium]|nr:hypothetical protein [Pseudonocardiales bacterium]
MLTGPRCRFCGSTAGELVLDLGHQPPSEYFPALSRPGPDPSFPLRMWCCAGCHLAQLADSDDVPESPRGVEPAALGEQRADAVDWLVGTGLLPPSGRVAEFPSSHGGSWLDLLGAHGLRAAGTDELADVVLDGSFGLMHAPDQRAALRQRVDRLRPGGRLVLQFHSLAAILADGQWNALRHGHFGYYSTPALSGMLGQLGLTVIGARRFPLYGGTVCLVATADPDLEDLGGRPGLESLLADELAAGVRDVAVLRGLQGAAARAAGQLNEFVTGHCAQGRRVFGYGAASRAVALLNLAGLDERLLLGVADAAAAKHGCRVPGTRIPILAPSELVEQAPDLVLVFVPELMAEVRAALPDIERAGGRWVDVSATDPHRQQSPDRTENLATSA